MDEIQREIGSPSSSSGRRNYLKQFTIQEITTPLTLQQQEQLADQLIHHIQHGSAEDKLPDYLEEFKRVYEGPNHLDVQLPVLSQLTPRTKRKLAVLPKATDYEMQKVRAIERSTRGKVQDLYASLSSKMPLKSQNELKEDRIEVINPSEINSIIPNSATAEVKDNKASEYLKHVESYQRHQSEQQSKIEKLFLAENKQPMVENRPSLSSTGEKKKLKRGRDAGSTQSPSPTPLPPTRLQPIPVSSLKSSESRPPSQSSSAYTPLSPTSPPSSAPQSMLSSRQLSYTPLSRTTATPIPTPSAHKSFLQSFSLKVFTEMGIHLDPAYNKHSRYSRALTIMFVYWRQTRLFSSISQWKSYVTYCQILERDLAGKRIFRSFRYFQFSSAMKIRVQKRINEKYAAETRYLENQRFLNRMSGIITRCVIRVGKLKKIRKLVKMRQAATCIQKHARGMMARRRYKHLRRERFRQRVCVLKIQRKYRHRLAVRKALLSRKLRFVEDWLASLDATSHAYRTCFTQAGAQYIIASLYRKTRLLKKLHRLVYLNQHAMAIKIQKHLRGYWVRKQFKVSRQDRELQLQREIIQAVIIQKYTRRYLSQMLLLRMIHAQDDARILKYNEKLFLLAQGPKNAFFHRLWHKLKYRGLLVWMKKEKKHNACARDIQRVYRGFHGRKRAKVVRVKNQVEVLNEELKLRRRSVIKIQKVFRGWRARRFMREARVTRLATLIQCGIRTYLSRIKLKKLKNQHHRAVKLTRIFRRLLRKRAFRLRYKRDQACAKVVVRVQRWIRGVMGRVRVSKIRNEARRRGEGGVTNRLHLIHLLSSIQMRILTDTLDIPLGSTGGGRSGGSSYSVCGVPPPCGGIFQALFVACICPAPRMDAQSLSTNKVDNVTMNKFFTKLPLFTSLSPNLPQVNSTSSSPPNPLVTLSRRPYLPQYGGLYAPAPSQDKEKVYMMSNSPDNSILSSKHMASIQSKVKPSPKANKSSSSNPTSTSTPTPLLLELLLGNLPFPPLVQALSIIDLDVIFSQSKNALNALKKLSFTEFLKVLGYMGRLQYEKGEVEGEHKDNDTTDVAMPKTDESVDNVLMKKEGGDVDIIDTDNMEEFRDEAYEAAQQVYQQRMIGRGDGQEEAFSLQTFVQANVHALNHKSNLFSLHRIRYPANIHTLFVPDRTTTETTSTVSKSVDYRLMIVLRLLVYLRDHEYIARAWQWLDMEARARLGLFATRIQCLMRKCLAKNSVIRRREELQSAEKARYVQAMVIRLQSWMRMILAYRKVVYLAQKTLRKYVPHMQQPYYYHPFTKVKSFKKPTILHGKDCYAVTIPDKSLEQVVLCFACHVRKAAVNCVECEESMCMVCFDSLHCKGIRARHTAIKIPVCAYCTMQVASISCLTCILTTPIKGHIKESIPHSDRGYYCDACFRFEHSPVQNKRYEANPTYRDNIRDMVLYSKEVYMVHKYISTPIHTSHQYEFLHTQCEACNVYSASWRCAECVMVYCHVCMVGIHSKHKGYIHHKVEVLPYYTPVMHESYKKDILKQELNVQLEKVRQRLAVEKEEMKYYSSIILQAWWRKIYYGRLGRRTMKKRRQRLRKAYRLRKEQEADRKSWSYRYAAFWGRAPDLTSDSREEKVLGKVVWYRKKIAQMYIDENKEDWGHYRVSPSKPRKGHFKTGFHVGSLEELHAQSLLGGYRLPGNVIVKNYDRYVETTCDLRHFLNPGEIVRIRKRLFIVVAVEGGHAGEWGKGPVTGPGVSYGGGGRVKLHRCWRHSPQDMGETGGDEDEAGGKEEKEEEEEKDKEEEDEHEDDDDENTPSTKKKAHKKKKKNNMFATLTNPLTSSANDLPLIEVMYRMPTYKYEPYRAITAMRLNIYGAVFHNPIVQIGVYISRAVYLRMARFAVYMYAQNKAQKQLIGAAEWKKRAFNYAQQAKYLGTFFASNDALVHLGGVSKEEAKKRAADKKRALANKTSQRRQSSDSDDSDDDGSEESWDNDDNDGRRKRNRRGKRKKRGSNQQGDNDMETGEDMDNPIPDSPRSKPLTPSRRFSSLSSRRSMARILAESDAENAAANTATSGTGGSRGTSPLTSLSLPFSLSLKSSRGGGSRGGSRGGAQGGGPDDEHLVTSRKSRKSKKKSTKLKKSSLSNRAPWYADADQLLARKQREDRMTIQELASEADEWEESVDIMTENVYYIHKPTKEMMTTIPRAILAKRSIEFENSKNKRAYDEARERIAKWERVTQNRLLLTGGRKK